LYTNSTLTLQKNLEPKIDAFKNCLKQWQHRKLTLLGKVTVIKYFAFKLPKLNYALSLSPLHSLKIIKNLEKCMFDFIWDNKPEKIKRDTLKKKYENGGIKMIDLRKYILSIKASWVKKKL
jgi:hypothetical protein